MADRGKGGVEIKIELIYKAEDKMNREAKLGVEVDKELSRSRETEVTSCTKWSDKKSEAGNIEREEEKKGEVEKKWYRRKYRWRMNMVFLDLMKTKSRIRELKLEKKEERKKKIRKEEEKVIRKE